MKLEDFNFELPEKLIAKFPCEHRDASNLLVYKHNQDLIEHKTFLDIVDYFSAGDVLVRNQTKVLAARFFVENQHGTKIEILLLKQETKTVWTALAKPTKRLKFFATKYRVADLEIEIFRKEDKVLVDFLSLDNFEKIISEHSQMPIPPYFRREAQELDKERYQTVYAKESRSGNSVAAPTAGLHFTDKVFEQLQNKGVEILDLTLHVGLGTFLPVKTENIADHKMHSEYYELSPQTWQKILDAKKNKKKIFAVGSTSVRTLETVAQSQQLQGETDIYIYPGFKFKVVDAMLTNFHLPKSSLLMMISAFIGLDKVHEIYQTAIEHEYRFFSYGDACLFISSSC